MQSLEKLNIDTPEQIALEFPLAGIGSRFLALMIDSLLQIIFLIVLFIVVALTASEWTNLHVLSNIVGAVVLFLVPFCIYWGYFAFFEIIWRGQTPGKRLAGIRVIHQSGRPATVVEAIGRNLLRGIDILPGMYAVGLICMLCNRQNRRLGDFVAGTIVVHDKTIDSVQPGWQQDGSSGVASPEISKLTSQDLLLIETYLSRRYELDSALRTTTARQIATIIQQKSGIERSPAQSDDDFLESVATHIRDTAGFR
jgi:uncharacterized RDD family membrane protein YckC